MQQYQELTQFLPLLQKEALGEWITNPDQLPFVNYGEVIYRLRDAIADFVSGHPQLNLYEYRKILEEQGYTLSLLETCDVAQADGRTVAAMLVAIWREERFCDGILLRFLENGRIKVWLQRLQQLDAEEA